jgi:transcriptional regulator with XRE-family HTH domain
LRRRARLSLRELSIEIGYSESHLSRIEHNEQSIESRFWRGLSLHSTLKTNQRSSSNC